MNTPLPTALHPNITQDGLTVTSLPRGGWTEWYIQTQPGRFKDPGDLQAAYLRFAEEHGIAMVLQRDIVSPAVLQPGELYAHATPWPCTVLQDISRDGTTRIESQLYGVSGLSMEPVMHRDQVVGSSFTEPAGRHLYLAGLTAPEPAATPAEQTATVLDDMEALLAGQEMDIHDIVRTWFFLDDILAWYDDFNQVRTRLWRARKIFDRLLPASTGIGMAPGAGGRLLLEVRAFVPAEGTAKPREVFSDKQCAADRYGSSFSRAVLESYPDLQRMHVSGTASINATGQTIHPDDLDLQILQTLDSIQHLLEAEKFGWEDTVRGIAYYAHDIDQARLDRHLADRGALDLPIIHVPGTVCRDDLLFELELEAARIDVGSVLEALPV